MRWYHWYLIVQIIGSFMVSRDKPNPFGSFIYLAIFNSLFYFLPVWGIVAIVRKFRTSTDKPPRSIFLPTYLIAFIVLFVYSVTIRLEATLVDPAQASGWVEAAQTQSILNSIAWDAITALFVTLIVAVPIDLLRRWRWNRRHTTAVQSKQPVLLDNQPDDGIPQKSELGLKLEDDQPDDGILPDMTRK